jgi:hypothetical protein
MAHPLGSDGNIAGNGVKTMAQGNGAGFGFLVALIIVIGILALHA